MNWPAKAAALGAIINKPSLHSRVVEYLESSPSSFGVACSGGSDSVAVLLLMFHHFPEVRSRMRVLHFNHKLREKESDEDAVFVERISESLGLEYICGDWDDRDPSLSVSEAQARELRQTFFDSFISQYPGALIVTGHQKNDILETLMLRIARSSNISGLAAPRPVSTFANGKVFVRPLLTVTKESVEAALIDCEIEWREDVSNKNPVFDRNRLRNEIIPAWQNATQFDLHQSAEQVREYLEEADDVLDRYLVATNFPSHECNPAILPDRSAPRGSLRRWLQKWLESHGLGGSFQLSMNHEILEAVIKGTNKQWSAGRGFIRVKGSEIIFQKEEENDQPPITETCLSIEGEIELPFGRKLASRVVQTTHSLLDDLKKGKYSESTTVLIDSERLSEKSFIVRQWRPGDRYQALNAPGSRKLQDMFVDRKISREERNHLPVVLTTDSIIVWCPGLPVCHKFRVSKKTNTILQLTYTL